MIESFIRKNMINTRAIKKMKNTRKYLFSVHNYPRVIINQFVTICDSMPRQIHHTGKLFVIIKTNRIVYKIPSDFHKLRFDQKKADGGH